MSQRRNMQTADRQDLDKLQNLLDRFAAPVGGDKNSRPALSREPSQRLSFLLREIDETVLPRRLEIASNDGCIFYLDISNRRLVGIGGPGVTQSGPQDGQTDSEYCAVLLLDVVKTPADLSYATSHRPSDYVDAGISCSCTMLSAALGLGPNETSLAQISRLIMAQSTATLRWDNGKSTGEYNGDTRWQKTLEQLRNASSSAKNAERITHISEGNLRCHVYPLSTRDAIVLATEEQGGLAAIMCTDAAFQALGSWQISQESGHP